MNIFGFISLFRKLQRSISGDEQMESAVSIIPLTLAPNPKYSNGKLWGYRPTRMIEKIVVHQELGEGTTVDVHNYHISDMSHLKRGGAPKIAYHYTVEKDGTIYKVNKDTDIVWHCKKHNLNSLGIMLVGDFDGPDHVGKSKPTVEQLDNLGKLLSYLMSVYPIITANELYGHCELFNKPVCPGNEVMKWLTKYRHKKLANVRI